MSPTIKTPNPKLRMIAGPNESGKSTLLNYLRTAFDFPLGYCVNPDEFNHQLKEHSRLYLGWQATTNQEEFHAFARAHPLFSLLPQPLPFIRNNILTARPDQQTDYVSLILCDFLRTKWINSGESFTFETVMSHPSKIDVLRNARQNGYRTYLYYICTEDVLINKERIANRVALGGHPVPTQAVESRFDRSLGLLNDAISHSNRSYIFDNSTQEHRLVAEFENGQLIEVSKNPPAWFVNQILR